jgi:hypothetical protein
MKHNILQKFIRQGNGALAAGSSKAIRKVSGRKRKKVTAFFEKNFFGVCKVAQKTEKQRGFGRKNFCTQRKKSVLYCF